MLADFLKYLDAKINKTDLKNFAFTSLPTCLKRDYFENPLCCKQELNKRYRISNMADFKNSL